MSIRNIIWIEREKNENKIRKSNLLLDISSNHILKDLLITTSISFLHKSHSLSQIVLPYDYQEGENQDCHRQLFTKLKGGEKI